MVQGRARTAHAARAIALAIGCALVATLSLGPGADPAVAYENPVRLPPECAHPSPVPECTFRVDARPPEEVFREGFAPDGSNRLLLDHVRAAEAPEFESAFVGTVRRMEASAALRNEGWVYAVYTSDNFFSVNNSLAEFAAKIADTPGGAVRARKAIALLDDARAVDGWSALGGIPASQVLAAWRQSPEGIVHGDILMNTAAVPPSTAPGTGGYGIHGTEVDDIPDCVLGPVLGRSTGSVCTYPRTQEELSSFHEGFEGSAQDVRFTAFAEDLHAGKDLKLAPLRDSNAALAEFDAVSGADGYAELRGVLQDSIPRELGAFHELSASDTLVQKVMGQAARGMEVGSELIPYVGLAATGYALREDIEADDWTDAAFDSVALALQWIEAVQPELVVFVEPLLVADLVAQWAVNHFSPGPPAPPPQDLRHLWEALDEWEAAADTIEPAQTAAAAQHLGDAFAALKQEQVHDVLDPRLAADLAAVEQMRLAYVRAVLRHSQEFVVDGVLAPEVVPHEVALLQTVNMTFRGIARLRGEQYRDAAAAQLLAAFDHAVAQWVPGDPEFEAFTELYEKHVTFEHLVPLESHLFSAQGAGAWNEAVTYPEICRTSITAAACVDARRALVAAKSTEISLLHRHRVAQGPHWAGAVRSYLAGARSVERWPQDILRFTTQRHRAPAPEERCTSGTFTSRDGWQRARIEVCARATADTGLTYTARATGEYFWAGGWYENDRDVRITTHVEARSGGRTTASGTTRATATPYCHWMLGCSPAHPRTQGTLTHEPVDSGLVITFATDVTGMYWSDAGTLNPTAADIANARMTLYLPAIDTARISDPVVKSVRLDGSRLSVDLDRTAFESATRHIVTINGQYAMETYAGQRYYSSVTTTGDTTRITGTFPDLRPGDTVEVLRTTGVPSGPHTTLASLATYLVG